MCEVQKELNKPTLASFLQPYYGRCVIGELLILFHRFLTSYHVAKVLENTRATSVRRCFMDVLREGVFGDKALDCIHVVLFNSTKSHLCLQKKKKTYVCVSVKTKTLWCARVTTRIEKEGGRGRKTFNQTPSQGSVTVLHWSSKALKQSSFFSLQQPSLVSTLLSHHHLRPLQLSALSGLCIQHNTNNWRQLKVNRFQSREPPGSGWQFWLDRFWRERLILVLRRGICCNRCRSNPKARFLGSAGSFYWPLNQ